MWHSYNGNKGRRVRHLLLPPSTMCRYGKDLP
ncbi:hypothetical protein GGR89_000629 [Sphingomonas trueperi]|uniref:Uncharacterized protein n=1 Tax=Sphingomonas trueperi TaxID=53317 RepID=A0A7X5XVX1_9SPHN|nr:hypothetical protein [Sphingomonas trueperi]